MAIMSEHLSGLFMVCSMGVSIGQDFIVDPSNSGFGLECSAGRRRTTG
jgi:hypothetical protein